MKLIVLFCLLASSLFAANITNIVANSTVLIANSSIISTVPSGSATVTIPGVDGANGTNTTAAQTTYTFTVPSTGANCVALVAACATSASITGVTCDGNSMTFKDSTNWLNVVTATNTVWYATGVSSGAHTVVVSCDIAPSFFCAGAVTVTNSAQSSTFGTSYFDMHPFNASSLGITNSGISALSTDLVIDFMMSYAWGGGVTRAAGAGQTVQVQNPDLGSSTGCAISSKPGAGPLAMSWFYNFDTQVSDVSIAIVIHGH